MLRHSKNKKKQLNQVHGFSQARFRPGSRPIKDFYLQNSFAWDRLCKISARSKTTAKLQDLNALKLLN